MGQLHLPLTLADRKLSPIQRNFKDCSKCVCSVASILSVVGKVSILFSGGVVGMSVHCNFVSAFQGVQCSVSY
jgi:hypothetical protein